MCTKFAFRRSPCGFQVLIGLLWVTFLLSAVILGAVYFVLNDSQLEVTLGESDEYVIGFPKLLCETVKIRKLEFVPGHKSWGTGCVMVAQREEFGAQKKVERSHKFSVKLYRESNEDLGRTNNVIIPQRMKSKTNVPYYWSTKELDRDDWTEYDYELKAEVQLADPHSDLVVQSSIFTDPYDLKENFKLEGNLCSLKNPQYNSIGDHLKVDKEDTGIESEIAVFCATSDSLDSYDNLTLNLEFDILKFNEILGEHDSCSNPPDDVKVYCAREFGRDNVDIDTECDVDLELFTKDYFDKHTYSLYNPVAIVVDQGVMNFTATCKIRLGWLLMVLAVQALFIAFVMTVAVCCFKRKDVPH